MNNNNANNNNLLPEWNDNNTITYNDLKNNGDPYDNTSDIFFLGEFHIYGAASVHSNLPLLPGGIVKEMFSMGPSSIIPNEECPICMEPYNTTDANQSIEVFPNGFSKCPIKFGCGFVCCFSCLWDWTDKREDDWLCFTCREKHTCGLFLKVEETASIKVPEPEKLADTEETIEQLFQSLEEAQKRIEAFIKIDERRKDKIKRLEKSNGQLKRQVDTLKRKLEVSSDVALKKIKLFRSPSPPVDNDKDDENV